LLESLGTGGEPLQRRTKTSKNKSIFVIYLISGRFYRADVDFDFDTPVDFVIDMPMDFDTGGLAIGDLRMAESQSSLVAGSARKIKKTNKQVWFIDRSTS
jgi:hypothetical protein